MERRGVHLPGSDLREGQFPAARHGDIGDLLVPDHGIHGQSLVRGYKRLFLSPDILAGKERFDDGGTGGGRADAGILHRLAFGLVGQFASGGFHRRQQARFRVKGARPGLFLFRAASFDGQLVALYDVGKEGHVLLFLLDRFIQDGPPARLDHDTAAGREIMPRALQGKGSVFFHAGPGKGFEHPPRDHLIDDAVVGIQFGGEVLGGKQRVVVGDLFVVHASAGERCGIHPARVFRETGIACHVPDECRNLLGHIFRYIA